MITNVERLTMVKYADSRAVREWRDKARVQAMSALSLANNPDYVVFAVRNSKSTLLGLAACQKREKEVLLLHLATRDSGQGVGSLLVDEVTTFANGLPIKTRPEISAKGFYYKLGWRHVGDEYWSR